MLGLLGMSILDTASASQVIAPLRVISGCLVRKLLIGPPRSGSGSITVLLLGIAFSSLLSELRCLGSALCALVPSVLLLLSLLLNFQGFPLAFRTLSPAASRSLALSCTTNTTVAKR